MLTIFLTSHTILRYLVLQMTVNAIKSQPDMVLLQNNFNSMTECSSSCNLRLNVSKSFLFRVSRRNTRSHYVYNINNEPVKCVKKVTDLGVVVRDDIRCFQQILLIYVIYVLFIA